VAHFAASKIVSLFFIGVFGGRWTVLALERLVGGFLVFTLSVVRLLVFGLLMLVGIRRPLFAIRFTVIVFLGVLLVNTFPLGACGDRICVLSFGAVCFLADCTIGFFILVFRVFGLLCAVADPVDGRLLFLHYSLGVLFDLASPLYA